MIKDRLYGNIGVYSPDGIFMFHANKRKLNFYIKTNLVEKIGDKKYQLTFVPGGVGNGNKGETFAIPRENRCVVTGITDYQVLTRHHIVPLVFRKHFPLEEKRNFQWVVFIEDKHHRDYTVEEHKFYNELAKKYNVPSILEFSSEYNDKLLVYRLAKNLLCHGDKMPSDKKGNLELNFVQLSGLQPTVENLMKYKKPSLKKKDVPEIEIVPGGFGKAIVAHIKDYQEFNLMWLNHFVETMKPQFLPEDLKIYL